jgi:hypothetical protein
MDYLATPCFGKLLLTSSLVTLPLNFILRSHFTPIGLYKHKEYEGKVYSVHKKHELKEYRGSGGDAPHIFNLESTWRRTASTFYLCINCLYVDKFLPLPEFKPRSNSRYPVSHVT